MNLGWYMTSPMLCSNTPWAPYVMLSPAAVRHCRRRHTGSDKRGLPTILRCSPVHAPHLQDNFIAGVLCFTATAAMLAVYVGRGATYRVWRLRWDVRRHRIFALKTAELALLAASLAAWTYCNHARTLERECKVGGWPRRMFMCRRC